MEGNTEQDEARADEPLTAPGDAVPSPKRQFCGRCGQMLAPALSECEVCSARVIASVPVAGYDESMSDVKAALQLYGGLLLVNLVLIMIVLVSKTRRVGELEIIAQILMSIIVVIWCGMRADLVKSLLSRVGAKRWYAVAFAIPGGSYLLAAMMTELAVRVLHVPNLQYLDTFTQMGWGFGAAILWVCVQPAVFEELAFRGVVQGAAEKITNPTQAIFISGALFAILHLSPLSMPHLLTLGFALGWLRLKSGSIYPGMVVHFLHNLLVIGIEKWGQTSWS